VGERDHGVDDVPIGLDIEAGHERAVDLDRVKRQVLQVRQHE
jgi:hypothetical protein